MKFRIAALVIAFLSAPVASYADAGRFQFVYGKVEIIGTDGSSRVAKRGLQVREGETIRTSRRGAAQLKMVDGAALAVRPRTEVRIDQYSYERKPKKDRSFFSLVRGTFRAITGLIGRNNRDSYKVSTATATIGIRGSDGLFGHDPSTGLTAVRTFDGGHSLTAPNQNGDPVTIQVNSGQIAVAQPGQAPTFAATFPFAANSPPPQQNGNQQQGGGDESNEQQTAQSDDGNPPPSEGNPPPGDGGPQPGDGGQLAQAGDPNVGDGPGNTFTGPDGPIMGPPIPPSTTTGAIALTNEVQQESDAILQQPAAIPPPEPVADDGFPPPGSVLAPPSVGVVGAYIRVDPANGLTPEAGSTRGSSEGASIFLVPGPGGQDSVPIGLRDPSDGSGFEFLATNGTLNAVQTQAILDSSDFALGAPVATATWAFWTGDFSVKESGQSDTVASPFHVASATPITTSVPLINPSFTYSAVGGTATNEVGAVSNNIYMFMSGTFDSSPSLGTIDTFDVRVDFPTNPGSNHWFLVNTGTETVENFIGEGGISLTGSCCTGPLPTPPSPPPAPNDVASGNAAGIFVGPNADGVITAIGGKTGSNKTVTGIVIGQRDPTPGA